MLQMGKVYRLKNEAGWVGSIMPFAKKGTHFTPVSVTNNSGVYNSASLRAVDPGDQQAWIAAYNKAFGNTATEATHWRFYEPDMIEVNDNGS